MNSPWMIYGATGYTGQLITEAAVRQGEKPILGGRNPALQETAKRLGTEARIFDLNQPDTVISALQGVRLVLNCAGPFSATATKLMDACLKTGTHYLDITGEISVFEAGHDRDTQAKAAGVIICPGVGFDVIPTDCVAVALRQSLPDATHLALGFDSRSPMSPGTAKTSVEGMGEGGKARINGQLTQVPFAWKVRRIDFGFGEKSATTIPWGDNATAFYSTGIPNIETYIAAPASLIRNMKIGNWLKPLFRLQLVQQFLKGRIEKTVRGPDEAKRAKLNTAVWGEARNARGETRTARLICANGYQLTIDGSLEMVKRSLAHQGSGGYYTPGMLCGPSLVESLPGSSSIRIS